MALLPWQKGIVTSITNETENTKKFRIRVPGLEKFDFKAGQFVTLDLPIHDKPAKRQRSYSIASWPDGSNEFELVIVFLEGGLGTQYLFSEIKEGSELNFRGPLGVFALPPVLDKDLFMICTGTGVAPFRSMMHYLQEHPVSHKNIYLIFGTRTKDNLLYYDDLKELATKIPDFYFIPTLSREKWEGRSGYVHEIYEELAASKQPADFMLCGWKVMIDEAKKRIAALGYDRKNIHQELYG
jgi:CDP-4-dehydro-6-deoxyglucose reductase